MFRRETDESHDKHHGFGPGFGPGGFRARRGMIEPAILEALLERPMHGYEIMDYIEEDSQGVWRPSAGSVYPTLQMLEEKDLVMAKTENGKKIYELTDTGKQEAATAKERHERMRGFWNNKKEEAHQMRAVREEVHEIMRTMRRFRGQSSPEKADRLLEMLRAFRHNLTELIEE